MRGTVKPYLLMLLMAMAWIVPGSLFGQSDFPYSVEQHSFVKYDLNHLQMPGSSSAYEPLFKKMDRCIFEGKGQVNVVHIGGSHIQADMWSDRMRQRLQTFFPGVQSGRGLIFPFKMAKTNNPWNYVPEWTGQWEACRNVQRKKNCTLGLTGISVTTRDTFTTLKISYRGDNYPRYECNRLRVFHEQGSDTYNVHPALPDTKYRISTNQELGFTEFLLDTLLTEVLLVIEKTDPLQNHFTLYGLALDNEDPGFVYHAIGVNGAATSSYLRCRLFADHMKAVRPDLVVFSIGINDANTTTADFDGRRYERNYDSLVAMVRAANPDAAIMFTTNNDSYYRRRYANKNAYKVRDIMLKLAQKHNGAVWDMFGVMGGLGSIKTWIRAGLANSDRIHLLKPGYVLMADLMFNALMEPYDAHLQQLHRSNR